MAAGVLRSTSAGRTTLRQRKYLSGSDPIGGRLGHGRGSGSASLHATTVQMLVGNLVNRQYVRYALADSVHWLTAANADACLREDRQLADKCVQRVICHEPSEHVKNCVRLLVDEA